MKRNTSSHGYIATALIVVLIFGGVYAVAKALSASDQPADPQMAHLAVNEYAALENLPMAPAVLNRWVMLAHRLLWVEEYARRLEGDGESLPPSYDVRYALWSKHYANAEEAMWDSISTAYNVGRFLPVALLVDDAVRDQ